MGSRSVAYPSDYVTAQGQNSETWTTPPLDGSLTYPELLAWHGKYSANHPIFVLAPESDEKEEAVVTYAELTRASFRLAARLREQIGDELVDGKPPVIGILAYPEALTYATWICAISSAGYTAFPLSPRNSLAAFQHLLNATGVRYLIGSVAEAGKPPTALQQVAATLLENNPQLRLIDAPSYHTLYPRLSHWPPAPYDPSADPAPDFRPVPGGRDAPLMILHSSGSTSFPKPIPSYDDTWTAWGKTQWYQDHDFCGTRWAIMSMPFFHIGGLSLGLSSPIVAGTVGVLFKPQDVPVIPTAQMILDAIRRCKAEFVFAVPSVCVEWSQDPKALEILRKCRAVKYGGGPLPEEAGNRLADAGVRVQVAYGMTEATSVLKGDTSTALGPREWMYAPFMPYITAELIPEGGNAFRLVLLENKNYKVSVSNWKPGVRAFDTNDLLEPHPTKKGYYKLIGRADDQIMMSNGEKTNPGPMEHIIMASPYVQSAIMFGRARTQVGVLIEPAQPINVEDEAEVARFRNLIWPEIEKANDYAPQHSRIFKEFILVTDPTKKPWPRTPKRTIARNALLQLYAEEINAIYAAAEHPTLAEWARPPASWDEQGVREFVVRVVNGVMRHDATHEGPVDETRDLFEQGCDSLQATYIRAAIANALREARESDADKKLPAPVIPQNLVFLHHTVTRLVAFVLDALAGNSEQGTTDHGVVVKGMLDMVEKYSTDLPVHAPSHPAGIGEVVLLTGSTGTLGTYILQDLLNRPTVARVYALNRPSSKELCLRQMEAFVDRGVSEELLQSPKLSLIEGDTTQADLGLDSELLHKIKHSVTAVIHNAWRLDFNLSLTSFESHVKGTRNLVDFALSCSGLHPAKFTFTSSIGTVSNWRERSPVPEEVIPDPMVALGTGYGQSKWVSERVLLAAAEQRGLPATIWRVGQLSGSTINGAWNTTDWVPIIVKSGLAIGALPSRPSTVDWLPTDKAACTIVDSVHTHQDQAFRYLNLVHPKPVAWDAVFGPMAKELGVSLVPLKEWVAKVEQESEKGGPGVVERIPAIKLLDFLRSVSGYGASGTSAQEHETAARQVTFQTEKARRVSETLRDLSQLNEGDVTGWLDYWRGHNLFD